MKRYRVLINGTNFQMPFELPERILKLRRMGFHTMVFVTAPSPQKAEFRAVAVLQRDKNLCAAIRNAKDDPPKLFVEEIHEIESFRGCRRPRSGLAFYVERGPKRTR